MAKKPEYSSGAGGNYAQFQPVPAGVRRSQADQADWNEISSYRSEAEDSLAAGFPASYVYTLPKATFNALGGVKTDTYTEPSLDPRFWAVNSFRRYAKWGVTGAGGNPIDGCVQNGTHALASAAAGADGTDADGIGYTVSTTTSVDTDATWGRAVTVAGYNQTRHNPYMAVKFKTGANSVTGVRIFVFIANSGTLVSSDAPTVNWVGIKMIPSVSSNFLLASGDGVSAATPTDTGVLAEASTLYKMELWVVSSVLYCRINNGVVKTHTDTMPADSTNMDNVCYGVHMRNRSAGTARTFTAYNGYFSQG